MVYVTLCLIPVNTLLAVAFWREPGLRWLAWVSAVWAVLDIAVVALNLAVR